MYVTRLALALALFAPSLAYAADGAVCSAAQFTQEVFRSPKPRGRHPVWCRVLLDNKTDGSGASVFNMATSELWLADEIAFKVSSGDCTGGTVAFTTGDVAGGVMAGLAATNPSLDLAAGTTDKSITVDAPIGLVITSTRTNFAGCTAGTDIIMVGYERAP